MVLIKLFKKRRSSSTLKKQKSKLDKYRLNELAESRYNVEQLCLAPAQRGSSNHRVIGISEDGIQLLNKNESEILEVIEWTSINHITLQNNLIIWEIYLKDGRNLFFKSPNALQMHNATDRFINSLIRNINNNNYLNNEIQNYQNDNSNNINNNYQNDFEYLI